MQAVLNTFPIMKAFEWGAGNSTEILASMVPSVTSVENDADYLEMVRQKFKVDGVSLIHEPDVQYYSQVNGDDYPYDLIFIDGRDRVNCMKKSFSILASDGIVILHDAEREEYLEGIKLYKYSFFTDNGNTAVLTNDDNRASEIRKLLSASSL